VFCGWSIITGGSADVPRTGKATPWKIEIEHALLTRINTANICTTALTRVMWLLLLLLLLL